MMSCMGCATHTANVQICLKNLHAELWICTSTCVLRFFTTQQVTGRAYEDSEGQMHHHRRTPMRPWQVVQVAMRIR
eukprot:2092477-Amphidinium_carterae.1